MNSRTLRLPVVEILHHRFPLYVKVGTRVSEAINFMKHHRVGCIMVVEEQKVVGVFTEHDLLVKMVGLNLNPEAIRVEDLMTRNPECIKPDDSVAFALNLMHIGRYRHLPIVDDEDRPLGILSVKDIVNHLVSRFEDEVIG